MPPTPSTGRVRPAARGSGRRVSRTSGRTGSPRPRPQGTQHLPDPRRIRRPGHRSARTGRSRTARRPPPVSLRRAEGYATPPARDRSGADRAGRVVDVRGRGDQRRPAEGRSRRERTARRHCDPLWSRFFDGRGGNPRIVVAPLPTSPDAPRGHFFDIFRGLQQTVYDIGLEGADLRRPGFEGEKPRQVVGKPVALDDIPIVVPPPLRVPVLGQLQQQILDRAGRRTVELDEIPDVARSRNTLAGLQPRDLRRRTLQGPGCLADTPAGHLSQPAELRSEPAPRKYRTPNVLGSSSWLVTYRLRSREGHAPAASCMCIMHCIRSCRCCPVKAVRRFDRSAIAPRRIIVHLYAAAYRRYDRYNVEESTCPQRWPSSSSVCRRSSPLCSSSA